MLRKDFSQRKHCTVGCEAESVELLKGSEWLVGAVTGRIPAKGPLPQPFPIMQAPALLQRSRFRAVRANISIGLKQSGRVALCRHEIQS